MTRLADVIETIMDIPMLPVALTENSRSKAVRVAGTLFCLVWFLPVATLAICVSALIAIPAMIQEA